MPFERLELRPWHRACIALVALASWLIPATAQAVTPQSDEVKAVVEPAMKWLATQSDGRLGGSCLIGLAFYKTDAPLDHPKIKEALEACEKGAAGGADNYSLGLALIFLCEVDAQQHRALAEKYVAAILKRQMANGGWGYYPGSTGDISQTQYPTLALWTAARHQIDVPIAAIEKDCSFLLRVQDPSGAWGYQAVDPGNYQRVPQSTIRPSLVSAGLGSLYICADLLQLTKLEEPKSGEGTQPSALKPVTSPEEAAKAKKRVPLTKNIDPALVRRAMADGNAWFDKNFTTNQNEWNHYYLYALERYQSFRELAEGKADPEPEWYNQCFEHLKKTQNANGSWTGQDNNVVATAFAVLFLVRSSQRTIRQVVKDLGDGVLLGGMGLPPNTADLRERDGKIVETPFAGSVEELLTVMNDPENPELARLADSAGALKLDSDVAKRSGQIARLRALVTAGAFESRLLAVKTLDRVREFDNVPVLIYALTDPDPQIVREADKGLRFISRKLEGVGLPDEPKPQDVQRAIAAWKAWYKAIRPDAEFLD